MVDLPVAGVLAPDSLGTVTAVQKLTHNAGNAATGGIWGVSGTAGSAVLKIARAPTSGDEESHAWPTADDPSHWNYWQREALAYTTGVTASYAPFGIHAPELISSSPVPGGSIALWLAEVPGTPGIAWTPAEFGSFARRLGAAQASFIGRIPDLPWLSSSWLEAYQNRTRLWAKWDVDWSHPLAEMWPAAVRSRLAALWEARSTVLAAARSASPLTLAHLDVWPMNLIGSALLDWSFVGSGGIGEDPANLIIDSVTDGLIPAAQLPAIAYAVMDSYVDGLRDGGYPGTPDAIRRAVKLYGAAKYAWFGPAIIGRAIHEGELGRGQYSVAGTVEEHLERHIGVVTLIADWSTAL